MVDPNECLSQARMMAAKAKDGTIKIKNIVYNLKFNHYDWTYKVYEDDMFMVSFNTKSLAKAKQFLREWLAN